MCELFAGAIECRDVRGHSCLDQAQGVGGQGIGWGDERVKGWARRRHIEKKWS